MSRSMQDRDQSISALQLNLNIKEENPYEKEELGLSVDLQNAPPSLCGIQLKYLSYVFIHHLVHSTLPFFVASSIIIPTPPFSLFHLNANPFHRTKLKLSIHLSQACDSGSPKCPLDAHNALFPRVVCTITDLFGCHRRAHG